MQPYDRSILSLFDPLRSPATPERDSASPDSASDKENDGRSPGQVTAFFNRVYKTAPSATPVKSLSGKLIDYDILVISQPCTEESMDEDEGGMILDGLDLAGEDQDAAEDKDIAMDELVVDEDTIQIPLSRRQPLADIHLESVLSSIPEPEPIPVAGSPETSMWDDGTTNVPAITVAPPGAPLASVINSINFSSLSLRPTDPPAESSPRFIDEARLRSHASPGIMAELALRPRPSPPVATPQGLSSFHLSPSPPTSFPGTRRLSPNTSATDPRRTSVDLQNSFRLQLQSPDMSFDLLNDKISFLSHDSFWNGPDDDSINLKKEEAKMMALAEQCEKQEFRQLQGQRVPLSAPAQSPVFSLPEQSKEKLEERRRSQSLAPAAIIDDSPDDASEPIVAELPPLSLPIADGKPSPVPVPAVPVLKIFKKSWKIHDRTNSVFSSTPHDFPFARPDSSASIASSTSSNSSGLRTESVPAKRPAPLPREEQRSGQPPVPAMQKARMIIKGVQRPPPGAQLPPSQPVGPTRVKAGTSEPVTARRLSTASTIPKLGSVGSGIGKMGPPAPQKPSQTAGSSRFLSSTLNVASKLTNTIRPTSSTNITSTNGGPTRPPRASVDSNPPPRSGLPVPQSKIPGVASGTRPTTSRLPTFGSKFGGTTASKRIP